MTRLVDIDPEHRRLSIAFPYDRELLDVVRALPQRRFDHQLKSWFVPAAHIEQVIVRLHPLSFTLSEALLAYCQQIGADLERWTATAAAANRPVIDLEAMPAGTWSVAMLNERAREVLHEAFREEVWLAGELQGYDRNKPQGHAFFELVHRPFHGANPSAQVAAVLWQDERQMIERALIEDGGHVRLRDGLIARFLARVDFYTAQGRYQLTLKDLDLAYTSGTIQQNRERILRDLEQRQLAEQNLMRAWPLCPIRIGLITSYESDAYADFVHELKQSGLGFMIDVFHVNVQGANTESSVLDALKYFERRAQDYDALAIVRGGGARSDLAYFDTPAIGEAVCLHPLKIVVGIGHQRDICLLDFIAYSEKTPTAAAQHLVDRVTAFLEQLNRLNLQISDAATTRCMEALDQLEHLGILTERAARERLSAHSKHLTRHGFQITRAATEVLHRANRRQERLERQIPVAAMTRYEQARHRLDNAQRRLEPARLLGPLTRKAQRLEDQHLRLKRLGLDKPQRLNLTLDLQQQRLRLLDPRRVLERGYALVYQHGKLLKDPSAVAPDAPLNIQLAHGSLSATPQPPIPSTTPQDQDGEQP